MDQNEKRWFICATLPNVKTGNPETHYLFRKVKGGVVFLTFNPGASYAEAFSSVEIHRLAHFVRNLFPMATNIRFMETPIIPANLRKVLNLA